MTKAGFNLAYFEHQVACEHSSSTAAESPVCILLISWELKGQGEILLVVKA